MDRGAVRVLDAEGPTLNLVEPEHGTARAVIWPGNGAVLRSLHYFSLRPGGRIQPQCHEMEAVYYVVDGGGRACGDANDGYDIEAGSMVHVDPDTVYSFVAGNSGAEIVGGPCPADPSLYLHLDYEEPKQWV